MTSRVTSGGLRLPDSAFTAQAPAYATAARSLAGRATELYEFATGQSSATGEPPITPPNPQGMTGWDLSGPPWGSALLHPVVGWSGTAPTTNLIQPDTSATSDLWYSESRPALVVVRFWNRPHERLTPTAVAPLARLHWRFASVRIAGTTTPTATARTWNPRVGQHRDTANALSFTTTSTETVITSSGLWVPAVPGWNSIYLEVLCSGGTTTHRLTNGCLQVVVKRSH